MKAGFIFSALIFLTIHLWGQPPILLDQEPGAMHHAIPDMDIQIIPPPGFGQATAFAGFEQRASGATIHLSELGGNLTANLPAFSNESLMSRGMFVKKEEVVRYGLHAGRMIEVEQYLRGSKLTKYILLFGDNNRTFLITSSFPKDVAAIGPMIRESMLTATIHKTP